MASKKVPSNTQLVGRARSALSVSAVDYYLNTTSPSSPAISTITLTPGRIRNIDQDMEALRESRQDNPFIKQIIASRESLVESIDEESEHTNLMSKELTIDVDVDPMSLPEMHEHMIRSPPPTTWPKSPGCRFFEFPHGEEETLQVEVETKLNKTDMKTKHSSWDGSDISPLRTLAKFHSPHSHPDRFSLFTPTALRPTTEDSVRLVSED